MLSLTIFLFSGAKIRQIIEKSKFKIQKDIKIFKNITKRCKMIN